MQPYHQFDGFLRRRQNFEVKGPVVFKIRIEKEVNLSAAGENFKNKL